MASPIKIQNRQEPLWTVRPGTCPRLILRSWIQDPPCGIGEIVFDLPLDLTVGPIAVLTWVFDALGPKGKMDVYTLRATHSRSNSALRRSVFDLIFVVECG